MFYHSDFFVVLSSGIGYTAFAKSLACALDGFDFSISTVHELSSREDKNSRQSCDLNPGLLVEKRKCNLRHIGPLTRLDEPYRHIRQTTEPNRTCHPPPTLPALACSCRAAAAAACVSLHNVSNFVKRVPRIKL